MRPRVLILFFITLFSLTGAAQQDTRMYRNAVGGRIEFGFGSWVGVSWKHLYTRHHATEVAVLFGNLTRVYDLEYHFNGNFPNSPNLQWVLGVGAAYATYKYFDTPEDFFLRPIIGIDARLKGTAINMGFDWRPLLHVSGEATTTRTRFSVPIRVTF
ncbi:MAG: hypothetical protein EOO12_02585 [Chitinophagaceae bacterium]|nr:MAG: hypothetical protein EOO12_02585 [Chitinophagaceae bacterium]